MLQCEQLLNQQIDDGVLKERLDYNAVKLLQGLRKRTQNANDKELNTFDIKN